jgi:preprotein translocase subunit SecD
MNPNLKWKAIFIAAVLVLCLYGLIGMPKLPTSWAQVKQNFRQRIKLGLDLQGGTHMILQVQVNEAVSLHCDQSIERLRRQLADNSITYEEIRRVDDPNTGVPGILVRNVNPDQVGAFRDIVRDNFTEWDMAPAAGEPSGFQLTMKAAYVAEIRTSTLRQAIETIRRRIDALGLTEPVVAEHGRGENEILVQLPGEGDPTRAKEVIRAGGQLELRRVVGERTFPSEAETYAFYGGKLPDGTELVRGRQETREAGSTGPQEVWYVLDRVPVVTGRDLRNAVPTPGDVPGRYEVNFTLSTEAARRFGPFTEANIGRQMAIVLDRRVESAPVIQNRIEDSGRITGRFTQQEAQDLALVLRAGALPASIKYLEERTIGPSLGADSIRQGIQASVVSLVVVMAFMLIYYRLSGINAVVALVLNLVFLLAALAYAGAVLTLPGIAGVILTIGMGVDTSVLVFERIREEIRAGKASASAVEAGFANAFRTVLDTHVTTIVSCVFLMMFGTGPVQGFAITLIIGLLSNLVTGIFVSRAIFEWHLGRMPRQAALSI